MIELTRNRLTFSFPEVHPEAKLEIDFQRTLRIPDDGHDYPLPPGLGRFPIFHVDDHAENVPPAWLEQGGVMMPMYQSEAMWLNFATAEIAGQASYPFAIKIAAGKIDAVTGNSWHQGLHRGPQDYVVAPEQPWLDGYCVEKGIIRQFVAMPLGAGYTAEEQITGRADTGGLQIAAYPMRREVFESRFPLRKRDHEEEEFDSDTLLCCSADMGLAPGGRMKQEIYRDPHNLEDWDFDHGSRCFMHIANSMVWQSITGSRPPHPAPTAKQYTQSGLPWFEYYDDIATAVDGAPILADVKSVAELSLQKGDVALPENESVTPDNLIVYRQGLKAGQVREGAF